MFVQPQFSALAAWSTIARSDYHALTATLRKRFQENLTFDVNYTWSKSMDNASGRQDEWYYRTSALILNPLDPEKNFSLSDFDVQHIVNSNWIWRLPVGKGQRYGQNFSGLAQAFLGGWELDGIFRWNSGRPQESPWETRWSTNFNIPSWGIRTRDPEPQPSKEGDHPNFWRDPLHAYNSYRDLKAGEMGDRNVLRMTDYVALDLGIRKAFEMPYAEGHRLTFGCEVFNVTNTQKLGVSERLALYPDPKLAIEPSPGFGRINSIQGMPRVMQFSLRYDF
jgi:hypothetical protein